MQVALWLGILVLLIIWIIWPSPRARPPVLLVVRDGDRAVEGVVRHLRAQGHEVMALDLGSSDESPAILRRLAREGRVELLGGDLVPALLGSQPLLLVIRVDEGFEVGETLAAIRLGR